MWRRTSALVLLVTLCNLLWSPSATRAQTPLNTRGPRLHVVLLTPRNDAFWTLFANITQAASEDLNIELEWLPALNDPQKQLRDAKAVLERKVHKPDAMIYKNYDHTALPILKMAEKAQVYSILFEDGLSPDELQKYGRPREKFKYWLGEFVPDQLEAGYDLAQELIRLARARKIHDSEGHIQILVLGGNMEETSSSDRIRGLQIALQRNPDVVVNEIAAGFWNEQVAYEKTHRLLQGYPDTAIIWTANATMPVGARRAATELGHPKILIGGVGATPPSAMDVAEQRLQTSVGAQFTLGGFILVLLRDYFAGYDFARESTMMRLKMYVFTPENVQAYARALQDNQWSKVDFRAFSKADHPQRLKYNFGFQPILDQLKNQH